MAIPLIYNVRSALHRPISTATTALGIGLTVAIFVGALALAAGFKASLVSTGSPDNALVLRKGADSEISSGISREAVSIIRANSGVARTAETGVRHKRLSMKARMRPGPSIALSSCASGDSIPDPIHFNTEVFACKSS